MSKTVRDWMQTEVWSSRTTKQIVVVLIGIYCALWAWIYVDRYWLNPEAHRTAQQMLVTAEAIRYASGPDYARQVVAAEAAQHAVGRDSLTSRDTLIEIYAGMAIADARMCRASELNVLPRKQGKVSKGFSQLAKSGCIEYPSVDRALRRALGTHTGF